MIRYGAVLTVASFVLFELLSYFGWTQKFRLQELTGGALGVNAPDEAIEDDRGCVLLDRAFSFASMPDFTQTHLDSWTNCQAILTNDDWSVEHCISPLAKHRTDMTTATTSEPGKEAESPSCLPGGYFRIQRLKATPTTANTIGSSAGATADRCTPAADLRLFGDSGEEEGGQPTLLETNAQKFLGPDTFRITLIGPERLILMQQQRLQNCTYAIPYLISEPGRFTVRRIEHLYEDFEAITPTAAAAPENKNRVVAKDILDSRPKNAYVFDVCSHCRAHRTRKGIARCSTDPKEGTKQYGTYQHVFGSEYQWVVARPPCEFYPTLDMFHNDTNQGNAGRTSTTGSITTGTGKKDELAEVKTKLQTCLQTTRRRILFAGDSHVRMLMEAVVQRLHGAQGDLNVEGGDDKAATKNVDADDDLSTGGQIQRKIGRWTFTYDNDPLLVKTMARLGYSLGRDIGTGEDEDEDGNEQPEVEDLDVLDQVDTVVVGLGSVAFTQQMTVPSYLKRVEKVLTSFVDLQNTRYFLNQKVDMRIVWMEMPVWTETEEREPLLSKRETSDDNARVGDVVEMLVPRQEDNDKTVNADDMRTNPKIQFCNKQVDKMLDRLNGVVRNGGTTTYPGGGVDRIPAFAITAPFRQTAQDGYHFTREVVVDALAAQTIHKLAMCP
ncbi:hypothetical protein BGW41_000920 [Actinomortierella wolfii]|nr:hypothetical protein BGW41_000920 [Actinomortierella wolfii]